jgi:predicted RNase H-like HicB family nuclease
MVIEKAEGNYSAYVPDLPGCVATTGATPEDTEIQIREAIEFHLEGLREDGVSIPSPSSRVQYVEVAAQRPSRESRCGLRNADALYS